MAPNVETTVTDFGTWEPTNFRYLINRMTDGNIQGPYGSHLGGLVIELIAGGTLNFGDVVQVSGAFTVNKATATLSKTIGVAVGGRKSSDGKASVLTNPALVGSYALALINGDVLVQIGGIVQVASDGAGLISAGDPIIPSGTTAGRVAKGTSALTIAAGATGVTSSAANGAIISGNGPATPIIGIALSAATNVAGTVFTMLLQVTR